jgi:hypothetical protein
MFQFTGFASTRLWIQRRNIRESRDQRSFVNSPRLIADFHALHRLLMPRHPPCALNSLTTNIHCSQTFASPLQALRSFFHFAPPKPNRWLSPVEHSSEDAIYARKNQIVKDQSQALVEPPLALRPEASPLGKAESKDLAAGCQRPPSVFLRFFSKSRKTARDCLLSAVPQPVFNRCRSTILSISGSKARGYRKLF